MWCVIYIYCKNNNKKQQLHHTNESSSAATTAKTATAILCSKSSINIRTFISTTEQLSLLSLSSLPSISFDVKSYFSLFFLYDYWSGEWGRKRKEEEGENPSSFSCPFLSSKSTLRTTVFLLLFLRSILHFWYNIIYIFIKVWSSPFFIIIFLH